MSQKFCKDCKWAVPDEDFPEMAKYLHCGHPDSYRNFVDMRAVGGSPS